MEEIEKLKKRTNAIIVIFTVALLVICGIFAYTITNNKEERSNKEESTTSTKLEEYKSEEKDNIEEVEPSSDKIETNESSSIENSKVLNARNNGSYWNEKESRTIPATIRINSANSKEAILNINYGSEYVKQFYKGITEIGTKEYTIRFDKNLKQVFIGEGSMTTGVGYETVFYLLEDGTIEYTPLAHALGYDFKAYKCTGQVNIKSYGKVDQRINSVTDIIRGGFALDAPYVGGGAITLAKRSDGYWYDLTNFLERTSYYK